MQSIRHISALALFILAGCGGGGGSDSPAAPPVSVTGSTEGSGSATSSASPGSGSQTPPPPTRADFSSFSATQANQTHVFASIGATTEFRAQQAQGGDWAFTHFHTYSYLYHFGGVEITYDTSGTLSRIQIHNAGMYGTLDFDRARGHEIRCSSSSCVASNPTQDLILVEPGRARWNYQTFGLWGGASLSSEGYLGAISFGAATPVTAMPTTGTANFAGIALGFYSDPNGVPYATGAVLSATVDFAARNIAFATSNTIISRNGADTQSPGLDLTGNLGFRDANTFQGQVRTQNQALTGVASGRFYGPNAEELGGSYGLSATQGTRMERMTGGFGGRR